MKTSTLATGIILSLLFTAACNGNKNLTAPQAPGIDETKNMNSADCPHWQNTYTGAQSGQVKTISTSSDNRGNMILQDSNVSYVVNGKTQYLVGNKNDSYAAYCTTAVSPTAGSTIPTDAIVIVTYQNGEPWQIINYITAVAGSPAFIYYVTDSTGKNVIQNEQFYPPTGQPRASQ